MRSLASCPPEAGTSSNALDHAHSPYRRTIVSKIWIDLDNTPHIPFFRPIISEMRAKGHDILLTARDAYQVCQLADRHGLSYIRIGRHYGKNKLMKLLGTVFRSLQLIPVALREKPDIAVSHGSRTQLLASWLLGISSVMIFDYEFAKALPLVHPTLALVPDIIPDAEIPFPLEITGKYPGLKEDVYVPSFQSTDDFRKTLGIAESCILVTVRPPATEAHYFCQESQDLFLAVMAMLRGRKDIRTIILPRNARQTEKIRKDYSGELSSGQFIIPQKVQEGLDLMWHSDLVISGGGTMNREAAALGLPVYSIYRGPIGAVDRYLSDKGRLVLIKGAHEISRIRIEKKDSGAVPGGGDIRTLPSIVDNILSVLIRNPGA
jgi:predicted glycosyltransferase